MANEFLDFYRSTFMGQRDQVNAEKKAAKAAAKAAQAEAENEKAQEEAQASVDFSEAKEKVNTFLNNLRDAIENAAKEAVNRKKEATVATEEPKNIEQTVDENVIEYTYKPGDTFGQVIKDLGLETDAGLWGADGDVAYYTQQLVEQGALDNRGNIPIGTKIKLRRRGTPEIQMAPEQTQVNAGEVVQEAMYPPLQKVTPVTPRRV